MPRVDAPHVVVADPQPVDDPGTEALDDDVRRGGETQKRGLAVRILEIDLYALHVPIGAVGVVRRFYLPPAYEGVGATLTMVEP